MGKNAFLTRNKIIGPGRKSALGMREARREKRQSRAVLAVIWGLLEQLGIGQKLLQKEVIGELQPNAQRSLSRSVLELCSAFKRVGISAARWAVQQQLPQWDWDEVKRMIRHLDQKSGKTMVLGSKLANQIKEHLDNAPRSYAESIHQAKNAKDIHLIVKGAEKAQRAQLTRLQTELERDGVDQLSTSKSLLAIRGKSKRFEENCQDDHFMSLKRRLETEIERTRYALSDLRLKVARHLVNIGDEEIIRAPMAAKMSRNQSIGVAKVRRGRPPASDRFATKQPSALDAAQQKWEMAYLEIKKLLKSSRRKSR